MSKPDPSPQSILASGVPEGFDARILLDERARNPGGLVVHVARDDKRMAAMQAALAFFAPDIPVLTFPAWDCLPFDRVSPNSDVSAARMSCLATLAHGLGGGAILLTTLNAATQKVPTRSTLQGATFSAAVGRQIDEHALRSPHCLQSR